MSNQRQRLIACFSTVFPDISMEEIERLSTAGYPEWDSIAGIQLACVIEEEFNIAIESTDLEELTSFDLVLDYLEKLDEKAS